MVLEFCDLVLFCALHRMTCDGAGTLKILPNATISSLLIFLSLHCICVLEAPYCAN
uniref:Uncharacterized protein n=1 Tax=Arundo donax TaxID=35708 RepID=A0A0A9GF90_ARUDO